MEIEPWSPAAPVRSSASQMINTCAGQMTAQYSDIQPAMPISIQTYAAQYSDDIHPAMSIIDMSIKDFVVSESAQQTIEPPLMEELSTAAPLKSSAPQTIQGCAPQMIAQDSDIHLAVTEDIEVLIQDCGDGCLSQHCCIYRVPSTLRDLKQNAYTPKVVSIGPFHCRSEGLQDMQRHKHILFRRFTQRTNSSCCELVEFVQKLEPRVRASYSDTIDLTEKELVKLTLMDAVFIIELFIMSYSGKVHNDAKLSQTWLENSVRLDLLLLENQLPFFVIEELFNKASLHDRCSGLPSFRKLTLRYFGCYDRQKLEPDSSVAINHFTDLLRLFYWEKKTSESEPNPKNFSDILRWFCLERKTSERKPNPHVEGVPEDENHILSYSANALKEADVKLKDCESKRLLDVKFSGHILEIPRIVVDDHTEFLFRNMIALEQCHYADHAYITDYAFLLDWLINTEKDVDLLVRKKIVRNYLGDTKNVATLFNGLLDNVVQSSIRPYYLETCQKLNEYCKDHWSMATLRRDYCQTRWRTIASVAAIVLLVLTVVQTIFSILQVVM